MKGTSDNHFWEIHVAGLKAAMLSARFFVVWNVSARRAVWRVQLRMGHCVDVRTLPAMLSAANIKAATQTIDGPAGVSKT